MNQSVESGDKIYPCLKFISMLGYLLNSFSVDFEQAKINPT